jgi:hypothetical protein
VQHGTSGVRSGAWRAQSGVRSGVRVGTSDARCGAQVQLPAQGQVQLPAQLSNSTGTAKSLIEPATQSPPELKRRCTPSASRIATTP